MTEIERKIDEMKTAAATFRNEAIKQRGLTVEKLRATTDSAKEDRLLNEALLWTNLKIDFGDAVGRLVELEDLQRR